ncbi:MAG: phosphatidylserine decarboxylase [bacterium TMED88]|nr:phosphatidylserine decarboxylase [Deltaproteobacteria bacterium]OUV29042.1 MAG: phosphatidylserine decarboxylase [bacterium TMED88]
MGGEESRLGWIGVIRLLPRSALSAALGRIAEVRIPGRLRRPLWRGFAAAVGADLAEVKDPLESFECLQAFFTRALRPGTRPLSTDLGDLVAPCDGAWGESGRVESGRLVQVKGRTYSLADFLEDPDCAARFEGGSFATFYLAPRDYHRFHAPCEARVQKATHVPGQLWPVNRIGLEGISDLFVRNERICAHMKMTDGSSEHATDLVMVAVGATLVGKIRLAFDDLTSRLREAEPTTHAYPEAIPLRRGEEWGRFEFGSTIVMIVGPGQASLAEKPPGTPLRLGEAIGRIR